jgi:solute carrier family 25 uncoupling protein 8/9
VALWKKVAAGASSGAIASGIANPTDLVKVRMQTDGMVKDASGEIIPKRYKGVIDCFTSTVKQEGVIGLWKGVGPTVGRATALAAAELATYDEVKAQFKKHHVITEDGLVLHASTALVSGFAATVASSPFDVVKSRVMAQPIDASGKGVLYSGMVSCFAKSVRSEGPFALYRGFWPNFGRVVPRVTIVFIVMEQLKINFG